MIDADADRLHGLVDEVVRSGGAVDFRIASANETTEAEDLVVDLRAKMPRLEVLVLGEPLAEGTLALVHGLRPALERGGGSVVALSSEGAVDLLDVLPDRAVSVNAATGVGDAAHEALGFLVGLRGEVRGYTFDVERLDRALRTDGFDSVCSDPSRFGSPLVR